MKVKVMVWSKRRKDWLPVVKRDIPGIMEMGSLVTFVLNKRGEFLLYRPAGQGRPMEKERFAKVEKPSPQEASK